MLTLDTIATFTWNYGNRFLLETAEGNFVWSDPGYPGGDNTLEDFEGDYNLWIKEQDIPFGRDKGDHSIRKYCGEGVLYKGKKLC